MDSKAFRRLFGDIAQSYGFRSESGTWFRESAETIVGLVLQKSHLGNFYYLELKIFVQNLAGKRHVGNRDLLKNHIGNIFRRAPREYYEAFSLDSITDGAKIDELFRKFLVPFTENALTKRGLLRLADDDQIFLFPQVRAELQDLITKDRERE